MRVLVGVLVSDRALQMLMYKIQWEAPYADDIYNQWMKASECTAVLIDHWRQRCGAEGVVSEPEGRILKTSWRYGVGRICQTFAEQLTDRRLILCAYSNHTTGCLTKTQATAKRSATGLNVVTFLRLSWRVGLLTAVGKQQSHTPKPQQSFQGRHHDVQELACSSQRVQTVVTGVLVQVRVMERTSDGSLGLSLQVCRKCREQVLVAVAGTVTSR